MTYKEKFALLKDWFPRIIDTVKKDLKNEHLKNDWNFLKLYFGNKNLNKITVEELTQAYARAIEDSAKGEEFGEFIASRWMVKNSEVYHFFEEQLSRINPDFSAIETLDAATSRQIAEGAVEQYGAIRTYLFCVFNSVVFPKEMYSQLEQQARDESRAQENTAQATEENSGWEAKLRAAEQQIARLTDKYEKKLSGLEKKYHQDVKQLKQQVATLQRKLESQTKALV